MRTLAIEPGIEPAGDHAGAASRCCRNALGRSEPWGSNRAGAGDARTYTRVLEKLPPRSSGRRRILGPHKSASTILEQKISTQRRRAAKKTEIFGAHFCAFAL